MASSPLRPYRVMTVCTGNICRSPMAEIVLRERFAEAGMGHVLVDSAGTSDEEHGNPVDPRARRVLERHGYTVPPHRARRVTDGDLRARDLVLAMTATHVHALENLVGGALAPGRLRMLRSFDPQVEGVSGHLLDVADPWYGVEEDFEDTLLMIEAAAAGVVAHVRAAH
ncbi:low molecular weight protein-tyrosine-phosphatase [Actinotalea sp.]|uniref:low molecular weight protein-tyrosine-phosphatase n=1 Tax=Actinotalea sp. TaxID=1872145 RepID=UPI0035623D3C